MTSVGAALGLAAAVGIGIAAANGGDGRDMRHVESAEATSSRGSQLHPDGGGVRPEQTQQGGATPGERLIPPEIVVKFKDNPDTAEIADLFWKDKEAARARFDSYKADKPYLRDLALKRATYSGELVLHLANPPADPEERAGRYRNCVKQLRDQSGVSYAEPNATAQPGSPR